MENIIFKCFQTPKHCYVYDRHTNLVVQLPQNEYRELIEIENGRLRAENSKCVKKYQSFGLLQKNIVREILHPETDNIEYLVNNNMQQLILQVTQQCNLRCAYCAYSGNYYNREHTNQRMNFDTAKKAIDFFLSKTKTTDRLTIGFYGGEPLLEIELIKKCVSYCHERVSEKYLSINLTTNGTLLTDSICRYFIDNDITITVSLDGPKEEHDINRKFRNGKGSFDTIICNLAYLKKVSPDFYKSRVLINTVINPKIKLACVEEYFAAEDLFENSNIMFSSLSTHNLKDSSIAMYEEDFDIPSKYEYLKLLLSLIGKLNKSSISKISKGSKDMIERFCTKMRIHAPINQRTHHGGPCVPGARKLFVTTQGDLYPCERVSECIDVMRIGNLSEGFNYDNIRYILNNGKLSEEECKNCWNLRICGICLGELDLKKGEKYSKQKKLTQCRISKNNSIAELREMCVLKELGYDEQFSGED